MKLISKFIYYLWLDNINSWRMCFQWKTLDFTISKLERLGLISLRWRHNGCDSVSNHQPHHCLLNRLFRRRSKKTSKLRVTGLCAGNSPGTGEFSAQILMASNAENVSISWRHHVILSYVPSIGGTMECVFVVLRKMFFGGELCWRNQHGHVVCYETVLVLWVIDICYSHRHITETS